MYIKCPQNPFCTPPATAKFALALGSDGETIHPPPVTKSVGVAPQTGGCDGDVGHVMSACALEAMTSASGGAPTGLLMVTCRALTSMLPDGPLTELDCSLITTVPALSGRTIVWFGAAVTVMGWPPLIELIDRLASSELPLTDGLLPLHWAAALDIRNSAVIMVPATVTLRSATEASDRLALPWPTVVAWATSAPLNAPALPSEICGKGGGGAPLAPPVGGSAPGAGSRGALRSHPEGCTAHARSPWIRVRAAGECH